MRRGIAHDLSHDRAVGVFERPAERIRQQLFGDRARELIGLVEQEARRPGNPSIVAPFTVVPLASTGRPDSSTVRHPPITSKFSSAKPSGSIME